MIIANTNNFINSLLAFTSATPVFLSMFFAFQILTIKNFNSGSKKIYFWFLIAIGFIHLIFASNEFNINSYTKYLLPLFSATLLAIPPLMYLYLLSLSYFQKKRIKPIFHLLPSIIVLLVSIVLFALILTLNRNTLLFNFIFKLFTFTTIGSMVVVFTIQNIIYIILSIKVYKEHIKQKTNILSFESGLNLRWFLLFLAGYIVLIIGVYSSSAITDVNNMSTLIYNIVVVFYIVFIGFNGLKQYDKYIEIIKEKANLINIESAENKDKVFEKRIENLVTEEIIEPKIILVQDKIEEIYNQILEVIETKQLYLNTEFTIFELSKELNINYKYVSQAINQGLNKNFVTFVNEYRVEHAKKLLLNPSHSNYTIEAISEMSGFKSKSSFNNFFKKHTGLTPSEFRQKVQVA